MVRGFQTSKVLAAAESFSVPNQINNVNRDTFIALKRKLMADEKKSTLLNKKGSAYLDLRLENSYFAAVTFSAKKVVYLRIAFMKC